MKDLSFQLHYKHPEWICQNKKQSFSAQNLEDIDIKIKEYLYQTYQKGSFKIHFYFDFDHFPTWMRQYMPHYFNRELTITL